MYTVYVLYSDAHDKHYTGYTSNMPLRLQSHNLYGHGWTKAYRPWRIIYTEEYQHKQQANYPLLLASQLNTTFEWNLTFRQYLALYRQCHDGEWDPFAYQFVVPRQEYIVKRDPLTNPYGIDYPAHSVYQHLSNNSVAMACNRNFSEINPTEDDCMDQVTQMAMANVLNVRKEWEAQQRTNFIREYTNTCLALSETFTATLEERSHHFTLYFYDQAGNLAKTVPPEGVELITEPSELTQVINHRSDPILNQPFFAEHTYQTHYWYNSLNQVIKQETPDGGVTRFWYDHLGRLVFSQSAKQLAMGDGVSPINVYSYTKYDALNRINQVGELVSSFPLHENSIISESTLSFWESFWVYQRRNIVRTFYDEAEFEDVQESFGPAGQENLRSRVASVAYYDKGTQAEDQYNHASHYSYDISGNVKTLIQENRYLAKIGHQYKRIDYEYDLVSGKVNEVKYQTDSLDEFFQRYIYDADNRLEESESSRNGIVYRTDARYQYYPHGPLARTIIGDGVQGQDYVYTLQGWIKSVNSPLLDKTADPGADGLDQSVSADVYGYSLGYYQGDYLAIGRNEEGFKSPEPIYSGTDFDEASPSLYNGNIRHMTVGLSQVQTNESNTIGYAYAYDQLNRLTGMDAWSGINPETGTWTATEALEAYKERVSYDQNGNILGYLRNGSSVEPLMDSLTYKYIPGKNRLRKVNDQVGIGNYSVDIDDHDEVAGEELYENYEYDESGNLTRDKAEDIDAIYWTPYGKIDSIVKIDGTQLKYYYDATGNRTGKRMYQGTDTTNTWYVRDAQGNVLTVYTQQGTIQLQLAENHLYGSSRLGLYAQDAQLFPKPVSMSSFLNLLLYKEGVKSYELTNHLGNVLATVSDVKIGQVIEDENVFHAIPRNQQDYYPFGMLMPQRSFTLPRYVPAPEECLTCAELRAFYAEYLMQNQNIDDPGLISALHAAYPQFDQLSSTQIMEACMFELVNGEMVWEEGANPGAAICPDGNIHQQLVYDQEGYRFGFNGKENDNEVKGAGNSVDFGARIYDPRLGRWLSVDPEMMQFPHESHYSFCSDSPVLYLDPDGRKKVLTHIYINTTTGATTTVVVESDELMPVKTVVPATGFGIDVHDTEKAYAWYDVNETVVHVIKDGKEVAKKTTITLGALRTITRFNLAWWADAKVDDGLLDGDWAGINWTSSEGRGGESRRGSGRINYEDIDILLSVLSNSPSTFKFQRLNDFYSLGVDIKDAWEKVFPAKSDKETSFDQNKVEHEQTEEPDSLPHAFNNTKYANPKFKGNKDKQNSTK